MRDENSNHDWEYVVEEQVQRDRKIAFPAQLREAIEMEHPSKGPSVFWNYERTVKYIVLSSRPLGEPNYMDAGRKKVFGVDNATEEKIQNGRIRVPDGVESVIRSRFQRGTRVYYLAYEEMVADDNPTLYLLTFDQLTALLPQAVVDADAETLRQSVLNNPGFIARPR